MSDPRPTMTPEQEFAARVRRAADQQCARLIGTEAGRHAAHRIAMSFLSAMRAARDPSAFARCAEASLATAIAMSAETRLYPGGPYPPVYLVPQSPRKGEPPDLQWRINHRGISILAYRAGFALRAVPVASTDFLAVSLGEVVEHRGDAAEWPRTLDAIQGIAVLVHDLDRGRDVIRAFVARGAIEQRRARSRDGAVWDQWPIEMAQGAAIRYLMARGSIPIDSPELSMALDADPDERAPQAVATPEAAVATPAAAVATPEAAVATPRSGMAAVQRALAAADTAPPDFAAESARLAAREAVPIEEAQPATPSSAGSPGPTAAQAGSSDEAASEKRRAHALEAALAARGGWEAVAAVRGRDGIEIDPQPTADVRRLRVRRDRAHAYAEALQASLDAPPPTSPVPLHVEPGAEG